MTRRMLFVASMLLVLCALATGAHAQSVDDWSRIQQLQAEIKADRQTVVTQNLPLTDAESRNFWPIYKEYRSEIEQLGDRLAKVITAYAANFEKMTDDRANAFFNEYLDIERDRMEVREKYVPRFRKVLPGQKAARFFQIENKLDAVVNVMIANEIPLVPLKK